MGKPWGIVFAILLFLIITFLYWKYTRAYAKKETGKKMWNQWGTRTFYWTGILFYSGGITVLIIVILKESNILTF